MQHFVLVHWDQRSAGKSYVPGAPIDGQLDVALIDSAMPKMPQTTRTSTDIIRRFTALPQYRELGSGQSGNQALLWEAVKQNAEGWVSAQGADPLEGAKWIDSLPFKTPADRAFIVGKLAKQWALSNPAAAAQWAAANSSYPAVK